MSTTQAEAVSSVPLVAGIGDDDHQGEKYRVSKGQETELGRNVCNCEKSLEGDGSQGAGKRKSKKIEVCLYAITLLFIIKSIKRLLCGGKKRRIGKD